MVASTSEVNRELLIVPVSKSLLIPCTESYPLSEFTPEDTLKQLYQNMLFNLGQVRKCYRKDEALIKEVIDKEGKFLESIRENQ